MGEGASSLPNSFVHNSGTRVHLTQGGCEGEIGKGLLASSRSLSLFLFLSFSDENKMDSFGL